MCGFTVILKKKISAFSEKKFFEAASLISHRGPDDYNFYSDDHIIMDFYRLKIQDLSNKGRQPMESLSGRFVIVFNGEIYNKEVLKRKINFKKLKGTSDTEILVNLFEKYKFEMMKYLEGMFSFVIFDKKTKKLFVARDRFGIKPLYYCNDKKFTIISSEIKPILKFTDQTKLDKKSAFEFFFNQRMDFNEKTFFENVKSLPPASVAVFDKENINIERYWSIQGNNIISNKKEVSQKFEYLLNKSIKQHLLSDVDIGLFLSGGTDSTILAKYLFDNNLKFKTYTYDFLSSGKYGESAKANKIAKILNLENIQTVIEPNYVMENFNTMIQTLESPFTSIRLFGDYKLYEICKFNKSKVILLGQGGDEIFSGYTYNTLAHNLDLKKNSNKNFNLIDQVNMTKDGQNYLFPKNFNEDFKQSYSSLHKENFEIESENLLKSSQLIDINYINLPRTLKYCDRLCMKHGIEARVPYLNHKLAEFGFNLDSKYKYENNETRALLKNYANKNKIRKFLSKNKKAIADPQREWLKFELKDFLMDKINSLSFLNSDIFDQKNVKKNYEMLIKGKLNTSFNLFQIITFNEFSNIFQKSN